MFDLDTTLTRNPDCPVREIGESYVILAPSGETTHALEDLAAFIWQHLDGQNDLGAVLKAILAEYDIDELTARADLLDFAQQLVETGLAVETRS